MMRIAVVGDFHLDGEDSAITRSAMEDIRDCRPDLVIPLGDFGTHDRIGTPAGLEEAFRLLRLAEAPLRPILGNHDLQRESGSGSQTKGTMEAALNRLSGLSAPYGVLEFENFRLFFVSTDPQPEHSCYQLQECYVSDEQFGLLVSELERRKGVPAVFFSHAPPLGCGLATIPYTHVRSTNAYLDQNHRPERWLELLRDYPEIVLWFSSHYHLNHHHPNAHTYRYGTHFFIAGVHGECTRDGHRHSRVIDIDADGLAVRTLDHAARRISGEGGWTFAAPLPLLMQPKRFARLAGLAVGVKPLLPNRLAALPDGRYLVASEDGYSWEVKPEWEAVMGAHHVNAGVRDLVAGKDGIWSAWERSIGFGRFDDPNRFARHPKGGSPACRTDAAAPVRCMASRPEGGVWVCMGNALWQAELIHHSSSEPSIELTALAELEEPPCQAIACGNSCLVLTASGTVYRWDGSRIRKEQAYGPLLAWGECREEMFALMLAESRLRIVRLRGGPAEGVELPIAGESLTPSELQIVGLSRQRALLRIRGELHLWDGTDCPVCRIHTDTGPVTAIARDESDPSAERFCFTALSGDGEPSVLEVWEVRPRRRRG